MNNTLSTFLSDVLPGPKGEDSSTATAPPAALASSPYDAAVVETLQTLIAPGRRIRLSPFVEAAQYQVLFGRSPDPRRRYEDATEMLNQNKAEIQGMAESWLAARGGVTPSRALDGTAVLQASLISELTLDAGKLQMVLLELVRLGKIGRHLAAIDLQAGFGVGIVATLDFLLAWSTVCDLYGVDFPLRELSIVGVDADSSRLSIAHNLLNAYADALNARLSLLDVQSRSRHHLVLGEQWARSVEWHNTTLDKISLSDIPDAPRLFLALKTGATLAPERAKALGFFTATLRAPDLAIVLERGDDLSTQALNAWKRELCDRHPQVRPILPCGGAYSPAPAQCQICVNARRESLHRPLLYQRLYAAAAVSLGYGQDKSKADEEEQLTWSYVCLAHASTLEQKENVEYAEPAVSGVIPDAVLRCIGTYREAQPAVHAPDEAVKTEYIKFCPAGLQGLSADRVALERASGFVVPPLRHGELAHLQAVKLVGYASNSRVWVLRRDHDNVAHVVPVEKRLPVTGTFLPAYAENVRAAIDELAFRLFGFPAMRPLQHDILSRVLVGKHILGIAATGGGKSECFILPAMLLPGITIVVSPLKSLMQDQYDQRIRDRYGLDHLATYINGDIPFADRQERLKRLEQGFYKLIYFTPEQLERGYVLDSLRRANERVGIRYITLDEAHCISQWGHDFRPSYLNLVTRLRTWDIHPVRIALTATASPDVRTDLCDELALDPRPLEAGGDVYVHSSNRPELNLIVRVKATTEEKVDDMMDELQTFTRDNRSDQVKGAAIVFMPYTGGHPDNTPGYLPKENPLNSNAGRWSAGVTRFASYVERQLREQVAIYHGKMDNDDGSADQATGRGGQKPLGDLSGRGRRQEQDAFIQGKHDLMIATKGFGMGIDKPNIRLIIHRTPTTNLEAYAQEAGRAGRDGEMANVILYYSPDKPNDLNPWGTHSPSSSDYEIQELFLSGKYVRRQDLIVMRAFLKTVTHRAGDYLYFTNDEALDFFNAAENRPAAAGLPAAYSWPVFPEREPSGWESDSHRFILDRGYLYSEKTNYINRILAALYRIRPDLGGHRRLAFLDEVQETGAQLVQPRLKDASAVVGANTYFGELLRSKNVTPQELQQWVDHGSREDILAFADFLGLAPRETQAMFWDICKADAQYDHKTWSSALLDLKMVAPPKYGPARGRTTLQQWRDYAGASRRASKPEAHRRASSAGRSEPIDDDWFSWHEVSGSKGWEVRPGSAFFMDDAFGNYLAVFMHLHDQRQQNDWAAYRRLLTDYVGVSGNGVLSRSGGHSCLRAVLLGYLRTNEVVVGDNCGSCSRCVPHGNFEPDMEKRKQLVVRLSSDVVDWIEIFEHMAMELPLVDQMEAFWNAVDVEVRAGRSAIAYIQGWSGRVLNDRPDHQAALWLRIEAMLSRRIPVLTEELVHNAQLLAEGCSPGHLPRILEAVEQSSEILSDRLSSVDLLRARLNQRLGRWPQAAQLWTAVLSHPGITSPVAGEAHAALATLHAENGPLPDVTQWEIHALEAARRALFDIPETAISAYAPLLQAWPRNRCEEEVSWLEQEPRFLPFVPALLNDWIRMHRQDVSDKWICERCLTHSAYRHWPAEQVVALIAQVAPATLLGYPVLASWYLGQASDSKKLQGLKPGAFAALALQCVCHHQPIPEDALRQLGTIVFGKLPESAAAALRTEHASDEAQRIRLFAELSTVYKPASLQALLRWLDWFSVEISKPEQRATTIPMIKKAASLVTAGYQKQSVEPALVEPLRELVVSFLQDPEYGESVHRLWLGVCATIPEEYSRYLTTLLKHLPATANFVDGTINGILDTKGVHATLLTLSQEGMKQTGYPRLDRLVNLAVQLGDVEKALRLSGYDKLTGHQIGAIAAAFAPQQNPASADVLAALLEHIRKYQNSNWKTPIAYHVEALVYARRFDEAIAIALKEPDLVVGSKRELASTFISRAAKGRSRDLPVHVSDYQKVILDATRNWSCCKYRG